MIVCNTARRAVGRWNVLCVAVVLTALNCLKPLHVDDPFLFRVAEQIVSHPTDPYGFEIFWMQWPQPAYEDLAPPVLPYWWAGALAIFGDRPLLWKIWLLPFAVLLTASLQSLFERFAREMAGPLVWMVVLSPIFLPGMNLMLDVPAVALGLCGLAIFMHSCDRQSFATAILAGLVAGLSMQTKYTGVMFPAVMLLYALVVRKMGLWLVASLFSLLVFAGWEGFVHLQYGQSMFLGQLQQSSIVDEFRERSSMVLPLMMHLGGLIPAIALAGLTALRLPRPMLVLAAGAFIAGMSVIACVSWQHTVFTVLGAFVCGTLLAVACRLCRSPSEKSRTPNRWRLRDEDLFVVLWFVLEIAGYFALAPWPAARRVIGVAVAASMLVGRLARRSGRSRRMRVDFRLVAISGVTLGLLFFAIDLREACKQKLAAETAVEVVLRLEPTERIWFLGHWGFQFYAQRAGMKPVIPDYSQLRAGEILVVPSGLPLQEIEYWNPEDFEPVQTIVVDNFVADVVPSLTTIPGYYGRDTPLEFQNQPQMTVSIFRVTRDIVPSTSWSPEQVAKWTQVVGQGTAVWAVPALVRGLRSGDPAERRTCARALGRIGASTNSAVDALRDARNDRDRDVRHAAADALQKITRRRVDRRSDPPVE